MQGDGGYVPYESLSDVKNMLLEQLKQMTTVFSAELNKGLGNMDKKLNKRRQEEQDKRRQEEQDKRRQEEEENKAYYDDYYSELMPEEELLMKEMEDKRRQEENKRRQEEDKRRQLDAPRLSASTSPGGFPPGDWGVHSSLLVSLSLLVQRVRPF